MARYIVPVLLFFLPFILYAVYLWVTNRKPTDREHWTARHLGLLTAAGLAIAVLIAGYAGSHTGLQLSGRNAEADRAEQSR